jgi:flavin-binding protein dodecin
MSDAVFKKIELVGTSPVSCEAAVANAVAKAAASLRN